MPLRNDLESTKKKSISLEKLIGEMEAAARFVEHHWSPADGRPGLEEAKALFQDRDIAEELYSLARAARTLDLERRVLRGPDRTAQRLLEKAKRLVLDLETACDAVTTVEALEPAAKALVKARARRQAPGTAVLAQGLRDLVGLAETLKPSLQRLGFDMGLLDEARRVAEELVTPHISEVARTRREARELRDHMLALADERVREVVAVCGYVFRHHPELRKASRRTRFRS